MKKDQIKIYNFPLIFFVYFFYSKLGLVLKIQRGSWRLTIFSHLSYLGEGCNVQRCVLFMMMAYLAILTVRLCTLDKKCCSTLLLSLKRNEKVFTLDELSL